MRLVKSMFIVAAALPLVASWEEDERCLQRRRRILFDHNETDTRFAKNIITKEEIQLRPRFTVDSPSNISSHHDEARFREQNRDLAEITYFQLKMYWEEGYCWQDEWIERKWCLECQSSSCQSYDYLWIKYCRSDEKEQRFVYRPVSGTGGGNLSPYSRQDLCWERTRVNAHQLKPCSDEPKQIIKGIEFNDKFEMHPNGLPDQCLEQHHDPKSEEVIRSNDCKEARKDHTNFWIMINKEKGDDDDGGDAPPGSDTINDLGQEYCDTHTCNRCQGDCDQDDHCSNSLRCFQRSGNEPVPGCKGGDGSDTRKCCFHSLNNQMMLPRRPKRPS